MRTELHSTILSRHLIALEEKEDVLSELKQGQSVQCLDKDKCIVQVKRGSSRVNGEDRAPTP